MLHTNERIIKHKVGLLNLAADLLNDRVLPFFERYELPMLRILTDRGTGYCGKAERHDYQLYLALNDIDHTKTQTKSPQGKMCCGRTLLATLEDGKRIWKKKFVG